MQNIWRKFKKALRLLRNPAFRNGLKYGVGASIEHEHIVRCESFNTLIDIGSNRGQFSLLAVGLNPRVRILAFEPLTAASRIFEHLFSKNKQVNLFRCAIGPTESVSFINVAAKNDSSSLLEFHKITETFAGTEQVGRDEIRVAPLHALISPESIERPCFCKIDVQGYELEVIRGCDELMEFIDLFYIECSSLEFYRHQPLVGTIIEEMNNRGFMIKRIGHVSGNRTTPGVMFDILFSREQVHEKITP